MGFPTERTLAEPLRVVRLHDPQFAPLDSTGSHLYGARWNSPGAEILYAALTYAGAILETRVHAITQDAPPREIAVITIPAGIRIAELIAADVHGWDDTDFAASRTAGDAWISGAKTVALVVPSRAGAPLERNIALNLRHSDARKLGVESLDAVPWDPRLFGAPQPHSAPYKPERKSVAPRKKK